MGTSSQSGSERQGGGVDSPEASQLRQKVAQLQGDLSPARTYGFGEKDLTPELLQEGERLLVREWNSPECEALRKPAAGFIYFHKHDQSGVRKAVEKGTAPWTISAAVEFVRDQGRTVNIPAGYEADMALRLEGQVKDFQALYHLVQQCHGLLAAYKIELGRIRKEEPVKEEPFWTVADMELTDKRKLSETGRKALLAAENLRETTFRLYIIEKLEAKIKLLEEFMNNVGEKIRGECISVHYYEFMQRQGGDSRLALTPKETELLLKLKKSLLEKLQARL